MISSTVDLYSKINLFEKHFTVVIKKIYTEYMYSMYIVQYWFT